MSWTIIFHSEVPNNLWGEAFYKHNGAEEPIQFIPYFFEVMQDLIPHEVDPKEGIIPFIGASPSKLVEALQLYHPPFQSPIIGDYSIIITEEEEDFFTMEVRNNHTLTPWSLKFNFTELWQIHQEDLFTLINNTIQKVKEAQTVLYSQEKKGILKTQSWIF